MSEDLSILCQLEQADVFLSCRRAAKDRPSQRMPLGEILRSAQDDGIEESYLASTRITYNRRLCRVSGMYCQYELRAAGRVTLVRPQPDLQRKIREILHYAQDDCNIMEAIA